MTNFNILNKGEISEKLSELRGWGLAGDALHMTLIFKDFKEAIDFINKVAKIADKLNHHPQITNTYSKVELLINTHEAGDKITTLDIDFAREVGGLL
ncbi:MAG: 4a-hydroxytetrahydrobiopterin dehydratase [Candidatus Paceibacterota bacterium]